MSDRIEILVTTGAKSDSSDGGVWFEYSGGTAKIPVSKSGDIDLSACKGQVDIVFVLDAAQLDWKKPPHNATKYKKVFHDQGRKSLQITETKRHFEGYTLSPDKTRITITSPNRDQMTYKYALSFKAEGAREFTHDPQIKNGGNTGIAMLANPALLVIGAIVIAAGSYLAGYLTPYPP